MKKIITAVGRSANDASCKFFEELKFVQMNTTPGGLDPEVFVVGDRQGVSMRNLKVLLLMSIFIFQNVICKSGADLPLVFEWKTKDSDFT